MNPHRRHQGQLSGGSRETGTNSQGLLERRISTELLEEILRQVESVDFGSVEIVIKDSRVVRIDTRSQKYVG